MPHIIANWPFLRDWLLFAVKRLVEPNIIQNWGPSSAPIFDGTGYISYSIMVYDPNPPVRSLPGLLDITLRLWMCNIRDRRFLSGLISPVSRFRISIQSGDARTEFFDFMDAYPDVVELVLGELYRTTQHKAPDIPFLSTTFHDILASTIAVPFEDIQTRTRVIQLRFLEGGAIPAIVAAMSRLLRCDISDKKELARIFSIAGTYFQYCFDNLGAWCVLQALESGWLDVMCKSVPLALQIQPNRPPGEEVRNLVLQRNLIDIYEILIYSICSFMDHPSILRAARKWYRKSEQWDVFKHVLPNMPCHAGWQFLYSTVEDKLQARRGYKMSSYQLCSNPKCSSKNVLMGELKQCTGCLSARYCSKVCQKDHWNSEHNSKCEITTGQYSIYKAPKIDRFFVKAMLYSRFAMLMRDAESVSEIKLYVDSYPVVVTLDIASPKHSEKARIRGGKQFIRGAGPSDAPVKRLVASGEYGRILFVGIIPDINGSAFRYVHWGRAGKIEPFYTAAEPLLKLGTTPQ
ncbi:hypothetical protein C8J56DRAFT_944293 [Mycena floridula]|nr:hypothetical protein C8J56DRAFT_944293 [Mycena floridula]